MSGKRTQKSAKVGTSLKKPHVKLSVIRPKAVCRLAKKIREMSWEITDVCLDSQGGFWIFQGVEIYGRSRPFNSAGGTSHCYLLGTVYRDQDGRYTLEGTLLDDIAQELKEALNRLDDTASDDTAPNDPG